jgi:hypothetical protein
MNCHADEVKATLVEAQLMSTGRLGTNLGHKKPDSILPEVWFTDVAALCVRCSRIKCASFTRVSSLQSCSGFEKNIHEEIQRNPRERFLKTFTQGYSIIFRIT